MKNLIMWPILILLILYYNSYIELGLVMLVITLLIFEKSVWDRNQIKKHNLKKDNQLSSKNESYDKIDEIYEQKSNNQNNYRFIEPLATEINDGENEKDEKRQNIALKQLSYIKLLSIYFFYSYLLVYLKSSTPDDICYGMPEMIMLFSILALTGILLKDRHQKLREKVIIFLVAFIPILFTGLSFYLSITQPKNYESIENFFLIVTGLMVLGLFLTIIKFAFHDKKI